MCNGWAFGKVVESLGWNISSCVGAGANKDLVRRIVEGWTEEKVG